MSQLRRALLAYALFGVVELAVWVAVILIAYDRGGPGLAATASVVQLVPAVVLAPPLAGFGGRVSRGTALATAHAAVAAATGVTALSITCGAPTVVVIAASATATTVLAVVRPMHFAALPQLAPEPHRLVSANATSSMADGFALFAGPVLAGFGAAAAGPGVVVTAATAAAGLAALLCVRLRLVPPTAQQRDSAGWRSAARSLGTVRRDAGLLALMLVMSTNFVIGGALDVLAVAFSDRVLGRGQAGAGALVGSLGIGACLGAMVAGRLTGSRRLTPVVVLGGLLQALAVALVATVGSAVAAVGAIALTGAGGALLTVAGRTLLQRVTDDELLAGLFAVLESSALLGFAVGAAVAPGLIVGFSPAGAFAPLGLAAAAVTVVPAALILRLDRRTLPVSPPRTQDTWRGTGAPAGSGSTPHG